MLRRRNSSTARCGFTLLEMVIALMVTAMIVFTLYRFVSAHLTTIQASVELGDEREALNTVVKLVQAQLNALPAAEQNALAGKANKFHGLSNDEITWACTAGAGLLTTAASGEFLVTLTVQPVDERSSETELGLRRQPVPGNKVSVELTRGGAGGHYDWLPLIRPMAMLEIRYFDPMSHSWSDRWTDGKRRPTLVRVRMQKHADDPPLEAVLGVPPTPSIQ